MQEYCDRVAVAAGLSPRETEILGYLGRGHGIVFVANSLVISESTVRTQVKSIYRKLHLSSREELLKLVDEA
ncbi:MAG: helix-turn-helix transcriptional regulator [Gordonibacter sp.]|nr:helix-turn-helix transcriptional regulator [Gordonibacter sp.]